MPRCWPRSTRARRAKFSTSGRGSRRRSTVSPPLWDTQLGRDVTIDHVDRRDIDNIRRRVVNIEKIRRMLHWVPATTLDHGLGATAQWLAGAVDRQDEPAAARQSRRPSQAGSA